MTQSRHETRIRRHLLRCDLCGNARECYPEDSLRYTREGWPQCCGQVMGLFAEQPRPGADDTTPDIRAMGG